MKLFLTIALWPVLLLPGCAKKNNALVVQYTAFPNRTGDQYTYIVSDSVNNTRYMVNVKVGAISSLDNGAPVTTWIYTYPGHSDTSYVLANQDSAVFYRNRQTSPSKIDVLDLYHFPLMVGAKWRTSFTGDTSMVVGCADLTAEGKTYHNAYEIHDHGHSYNYTSNKQIWFAQNIGVIRMDYKTLGTNETWQLVNQVIK